MKERYTDIDEYIRDLQQEIRGNENCANHYYNLGVALLSKNDFVEAEEAFLGALRNSPHLAEAYVQLGGICMQRGDLDGCLRYNEEAANCRARFAIPWSNIGFVHVQRGNAGEAVKALKKALKWDPDFVQARATYASALYMLGEYDASIENSRQALRKEPAFGPAWNNLSLAQFAKGEFVQAMESADQAMACGYGVSPEYLRELRAQCPK